MKEMLNSSHFILHPSEKEGEMKRLETIGTVVNRKGERGSVLAISAFGMLALVLALGLCVDVSHWYVVKAELQNAADASALAGASALNSAPAGIDAAQQRAVEVMNN